MTNIEQGMSNAEGKKTLLQLRLDFDIQNSLFDIHYSPL
jgi:hypothetical protein